jgi:thioredoxin reductase (NADPH)
MTEIYDIIIIGGGPAGYTAGIYAARAGWKTLMFTGIMPGGQLMNTTMVENFPGFEKILGPDLMEKMFQQTEKSGVKLLSEKIIKVNFKKKPFSVFTKSKEFLAKSVIICTGADYKKLGIVGEKEFSGRGVSYCAVCDGPLFQGEELAVVGGGDSAMEEAIFLSHYAKKVHVIHRRDTLKASKVMQEKAFKIKKIEFHWNTEVKEIKGDEHKVREIIVMNNKTKKQSVMKAGGIFIAIGHVPNTEIFKEQLALDKKGYIVLKKNSETSSTGVFAAGDVHDYIYRQAVTAAGFGCMAALDADRYLRGH